MTLSRYHQRNRRETQFIIAVETICAALRQWVVFNEFVPEWWTYLDREAA